MATWLYLDLEDEREVYAEQIAGAANTPLSFTDGGYLELGDDELAETIARRKKHVYLAAEHPDADLSTVSSTNDSDTDEEDEATSGESDAITELLEGTVAEITAALESGDWDDQLDEIAERAERVTLQDAVEDLRDTEEA